MTAGVIAFDFDGSIAYAPAGTTPAYHDPLLGLARSAALPAGVQLMRKLEAAGHELHVVTGRGMAHHAALRYWLRLFLGHSVRVWCRPSEVGLACVEQASWKARVLGAIKAAGIVGDNDRIDRVAAAENSIHYLDARVLRAGLLPGFDVDAGWQMPPRMCLPQGGSLLPAWPDARIFEGRDVVD